MRSATAPSGSTASRTRSARATTRRPPATRAATTRWCTRPRAEMLAGLVALLALATPAAADPGYTFAHSLANAGPRPAAGSAERHAHLRVAKVFQLEGLPAAKLGQPGNPCRHQPCDTAGKLQQQTFVIVRRTVERLLSGGLSCAGGARWGRPAPGQGPRAPAPPDRPQK